MSQRRGRAGLTAARTAAWLVSLLAPARAACLGALLLLLPAAAALAQTSLVSAPAPQLAPLFKQIDPAFSASYKKVTGRDVRIDEKSGPPAMLAKPGAEGPVADVVAFADPAQADALADAGVIATDWSKQFPSGSAPWFTTVVFVVREGNPRRIKNWSDLARPGLKVVLPDPASTASGRHAWLGAWGAIRKNGGSDERAASQAAKLLANSGLPAASDELAAERYIKQRDGDVLIALERDLPNIMQTALEQGTAKLAVVVPPMGILVAQPVALLPASTRKKGTGELAKAYLNFLYTEPAQQMAAMHSLRPASKEMLKAQAARFRPIKLFGVAEVFGSEAEAQQAHFSADGWFEKLRAAQAAKPLAAATSGAKTR
ncbi:MAG: sulfate ABC transporter substrate-binding protein [Burkholderiales bacterium]